MLRPIVRDLEKESVEPKLTFQWIGEEPQGYVKKDITYLIEPDCPKARWERFLEDVDGVCISLQAFQDTSLMVP